jgi:heme-degrading monooxygenase HmoA
MLLFYAIHYPKPGMEEPLIERMREFGALIQQQPGVVFVNPTPFRDAENGTFISLIVWESKQAFEAVWPALVEHAPSEEMETRPREVRLFPAAG